MPDPAISSAPAGIEICPHKSVDQLEVWSHRGRNNRLVLAFSGVAANDGTKAGPSFAKKATQGGVNHVLYFADHGCSWLNDPGLIEAICGTVADYKMAHGLSSVHTIGHSMGATMAIAMAGFTPVKSVLALSPQVSIDFEIAPFEAHRHWAKVFAERSGHYRVRELGATISERTDYMVCFGDQKGELVHAKLMPRAKNIWQVTLPDTGHHSYRPINNSGQMDALIGHVFNGHLWRAQRLLVSELGASAVQQAEVANHG